MASGQPSPLANLHPAQCRSRINGHGEANFNNLRAITLLICGTWPTAAELFPDAPQLNVIASHVEERLTAVSKRQQGGHRASTLRALDAPPPDAVASAALATQVRDAAVCESLWLENPDHRRARHRPIHQLGHAALQEYRGQLIAQLDT
ncbi:hypothetical protein [Streptomyces sp. NEAU-YJ-81]|uniref:hypothetical protein n=1 Tax=Streptomyces sp. NEAU-YJ-81 TaxID=2820288 RepID=UPI001ABC059B|nr:hypothetical protein [Streptomyces sp. NEAU-YJ-81]MBO3678765.1 hypothetical protein [Streptomyces sp. NEAU-YJ-81]